MDCLSRLGKGLNLLTPDIDPGQILTVLLRPEQQKFFFPNFVEESGMCVMC